jgi:hypothetical protein
MKIPILLMIATTGCLAVQPTVDGGTLDGGPSEVIPTSGPVRFEFPMQRCRFTKAEAAAGISFLYDVVVEAAESSFVQSEPPTGQTCASPKTGAELYVFEQISGNGKTYCECDRGNCLRGSSKVGAKAGRSSLTFPWDGREWQGPSDTGNPKGPAFPPGEYTFNVKSTVSDSRADAGTRDITGRFTFTIVP